MAVGKGLTRTQAKVSALMESLEGFHGERVPAADAVAALREMAPQLGYDPFSLPVVKRADAAWADPGYDPFAPPVGSPTYLSDDSELEWIEAEEVDTRRPTWVPRQLIDLDFSVQERPTIPFFRASTNGLATGNSHAEAELHGLCEVIERDAMWRSRRAVRQRRRRVDLASITSRSAAALVERLSRPGTRLEVLDVTSPVGVACFEAFLRHDDPGASGAYYGAGCHPSRTVALIRAITEAAQSRLAYIAGGRDDLFRARYAGMRPHGLAAERPSGESGPYVSFEAIPGLPLSSPTALVREIAARVRAVTGAAPVAVDLERPDFGLAVVHVVAPGLRIVPPSRA